MGSLRRLLYLLASLLGDIAAIRKGPYAIIRRMLRKEFYRQLFRWFRF